MKVKFDMNKPQIVGLGEVVFDNNIDKLITIGNESVNIEKRAIELGMDKDNCYHFNVENECYQLLDDLLKSNDIVLLKGSHGIHLDRVVEKLV